MSAGVCFGRNVGLGGNQGFWAELGYARPVQKSNLYRTRQAHELTFSVKDRVPVFKDAWAAEVFLAALDKARRRYEFEVWGYVVMPDHVHLLVWPKLEPYSIETFRQALKMPCSRQVLARMRQENDPRLERLTDKLGCRVWERGAGYDRNLGQEDDLKNCLNYIHNNPVKAGLVQLSQEYPYSSSSWYSGESIHWFEPDPIKLKNGSSLLLLRIRFIALKTVQPKAPFLA
jgi:putative transposase